MENKRLYEVIRQDTWCGAMKMVIAVGPGYKHDHRFFLDLARGDEDLQDQMISSNELLSVDKWIPQYAPYSDDNFCGVNRSVDIPRLAGHRVAARGTPWREGIMCAAIQVVRYGGNPDTLVVPAKSYAALMEETMYGELIRYHPRGEFKYLCVEPCDEAYVLQSNTFCWYDWPSEEYLWSGQLICNGPVYNARIIDFCDN